MHEEDVKEPSPLLQPTIAAAVSVQLLFLRMYTHLSSRIGNLPTPKAPGLISKKIGPLLDIGADFSEAKIGFSAMAKADS